jgi:hypothetical protein
VRRAHEKVLTLNPLLQSPFQAPAEGFFDHLLKAFVSVVILNISDESSVEPFVRDCSRYYCGDDGILQFLDASYKVIS